MDDVVDERVQDNDPQFARERFHAWVGHEPEAWRITAQELKRAADAVAVQWQRDLGGPTRRADPTKVPPAVGPAYMLLAAFAIENLAKGILIGRDPGQFPLRSARRGGLKTHDLLELVNQIGGTWSGEEHTLLRRLTKFAAWGGRYPVPLAPDELAAWRGEDDVVFCPDGTPEVIAGVTYAHDPSDVDRLFWKLNGFLESEEAQRRFNASAHLAVPS